MKQRMWGEVFQADAKLNRRAGSTLGGPSTPRARGRRHERVLP